MCIVAYEYHYQCEKRALRGKKDKTVHGAHKSFGGVKMQGAHQVRTLVWPFIVPAPESQTYNVVSEPLKAVSMMGFTCRRVKDSQVQVLEHEAELYHKTEYQHRDRFRGVLVSVIVIAARVAVFDRYRTTAGIDGIVWLGDRIIGIRVAFVHKEPGDAREHDAAYAIQSAESCDIARV
jgi:hypothetical protein